jgi:tetratricopeptide (TPR) repeat protein
MSGFPKRIQRHRTVLLLACVVGAIVFLAAWLLPRWLQKDDPLVTTPRLALEALTANSLYFNAAARPWLLAQRPDLLTPEDRDERSDRTRAFVQAVANPKLFRQLDRRHRFDTLLLVGDPSQYRTLLDKLLEEKDFTLTYADHTSLVFRRDGVPWTKDALAPLRSKFAASSKRDRATVLALTGSKLVAARRSEEGRALLEEARALDPSVPEAWSGLALDQMNRGNWAEAITDADRALDIDKQHLGALSIKTQCFVATKRFNEAYALSKQLVERLPDDPNILFKHAQIAHEAHAYKAEIEALEKLIARAEAEERETTGYRMYLAQAHMAASNGAKAIENFERVLADPALPQDQRDFARDSVQRIKSRTGL